MKKKLLLVYVFVAFVLLCTNVYAVLTMDVNLVADKTSVKPGEEVVVTIGLKNISKPISSIEGYINIDETLFKEAIKDAVVIKDNKIEVTSGNTVENKLTYAFNPTSTNADYDVIFNTNRENIENNDCFFLMDFANDVENTADILKLKFTIKDDAIIKKVEDAVKVDFLVAYSSDASERTEKMSATLDVEVVNAEPSAEENNTANNATNNTVNNAVNNTNTNKNTNTNNTNTNKNNTNVNNTNTNKNTNNTNTNNKANNVVNNTNTNKDGTVAGTNIPAAGAGFIIAPIVVFAILAYISYNKYIKYKDI